MSTKYVQLGDKVWLDRRYSDDCACASEIAKEVGCEQSAVLRALKHQGIPRRQHTSSYPQLNDKEWLAALYLDERLSLKQIALKVGCSFGNVYSALTRLGIEIRGIKEGLSTRYPEGRIGDQASNWRGGRRVCSEAKPQYLPRLGDKAAHWKGGRHVLAQGYVYIHKPEHPNATKAGYVMEHRLVVEEHLGRPLKPNEVVHHLDGDRQNNVWENLEVVTRSDHVSNHFKDSREVLALRVEVLELREKLAEYERRFGPLD